MTDMTKLEKLSHLKAIVESIPAEKLHLKNFRDVWAQDGETVSHMLERGAVADVFGWASADPTFQEMGFNFVFGEPVHMLSDFLINGQLILIDGEREDRDWLYGWEAVTNFFGLSKAEMGFLNRPSSYFGSSDAYQDASAAHISKELILSHIDVVIELQTSTAHERMEKLPKDLLGFLKGSTLAFENWLDVQSKDGQDYFHAIVYCYNKNLPELGSLKFSALMLLDAYDSPFTSIEDQIKSGEPLQFVPVVTEEFKAMLLKHPIAVLLQHPIDGLHPEWTQAEQSPYSKEVNELLGSAFTSFMEKHNKH